MFLQVFICADCNSYLKRNLTPKYALANNLYMGIVPSVLQKLNSIEQSCISLVRIRMNIYKYNTYTSGTVLKFRGNVIAFPQDPIELLQTLPNLPNSEDIQILFVGKNQPTIIDLNKLFNVRKQVGVIDPIRWLQHHNWIYKKITISKSKIDELPYNGVPNFILNNIQNVTADDLNFQENKGYDGINSNSKEILDTDPNDIVELDCKLLCQHNEALELEYLQKLVLVSKNMKQSTNQNKLVNQINSAQIIPDTKSTLRDVITLPHGPEPLNEIKNPVLLIASYPHLFPYGVGGFHDTKRKTKLTAREHIQYLLEIEDERFRKDKTFQCVVFNQIQRAECRNRINLMIRRKDFNNFAKEFKFIKQEDIQKAVDIFIKTNKIEMSSTIGKLLSRVQSASVKVQGSKASLYDRRMDMKSYIIHWGLPLFYLTINPADAHHPLFLFMAGESISLNSLTIKNSFQRMNIVKQNPYTQAKFFDKIMKSFIEYILCFNDSEPTEGLLGVVKAYYAVIEAADRGSLHSHLLIWINTGLNSVDLARKLQDPNFIERLITYIDSIIKCDLSEFNVRETINQEIHDIHPCCRDLGLASNKEFKEKIMIYILAIYLIVICSNIHKCGTYCLNNNICRYGFPKSLVDRTTIDTLTGEISIKRADPYTNNFIPVVSASAKCNNDAKILGFLTSNSPLNVVYYLTNYLSKYGLTTYDSISYSLIAFNKYEKYKDTDDDDTQKARRIISMMYNAAANRTEYSGAQVASMILNNGRDGTYYSSHKTVVLNLYRLLAKLDQYDDSNDLILIPRQFNEYDESYGLQYDYENRDISLSDMCIYEYVSRFSKVKTTINKSEYLNYATDHKQFNTHKLKKNKDILVPFILGASIPRKDDPDNTELYAKNILILFKPWNKLDNFIQKNQTFSTQLNSYIEYLDKNNKSDILEYIINVELLKKSIDDATEIRRDKSKSNDMKKHNANIFFNINTQGDSDELILNYTQFELDQLLDDEANNEKSNEIKNWETKRINVVKSYFEINATNYTSKNIITNYNNIIPLVETNYTFDINNWQQQLKTYKKNDITIQTINTFPQLNSSINSDIQHISIVETDIIRKFQLNKNQTICYKLFTDLFAKHQSNSPQQMIMQLTGSGGVGKTRLIKSIEYFFASKNASHRLCLTSSTASSANVLSEKCNSFNLFLKIS
jgi:hypothetical protein